MNADLAARLRVEPEQLRRRYDPQSLGIETTADLEPLDGIVGQDRAMAAIRFGLGMPSTSGFNIYVAGPPGIGKMTAVEAFLKSASASEQVPPDIAYVNRFEDSYEPRALVLPTGTARVFREQMRKLIASIIEEIPRAFEDDEYQHARREIDKDQSSERSELLEALEAKAKECKHHIKLTPMGFLMVPVFGERELDEGGLAELPEQTREELQRLGEELKETIHDVLKQIRKIERAAKESREALDRKVALYALEHQVDALAKAYADHEGVQAYLEEVQDSLLRWVEVLRRATESDGDGSVELNVAAYDVNVLVDNAGTEGAPVVVERNPTISNLCGRIEKESEVGGVFSTDFRMIRSGSLHRANGGYLVLPVEPLLRSPFSYDALKRALHARELQIEEPTERLGLISTKSLRPDAIPLGVKVVLVGPWELYYLLHRHDSEFAELFKVKADFDTRIDVAETSVREFLRFLRRLTAAESLRALDAAHELLEIAVCLKDF